MIIGVGTDIIEIERIRKAIQREHFKDKVYTKTEQNYCESRGSQSAASYAARFAAKEAFFKAAGTGIITALSEVEVINDELGQPKFFLHGKAKNLCSGNIFLSLSHSREYATAVAIIEN